MPLTIVTRLAVVAVVAIVAAVAQSAGAQDPAPAWSADLAGIRAAASLIPGRRPLRLNVQTFAESRRTKNFSVEGAPAEPSVQARTAFQVMFADGRVMVDAGMDQQVHRFFGRGAEEPYDAAAARQVERALVDARLIVVTHEHGDHVAGVVHTPRARELASKTILTRSQVRTLLTSPQMPEIALTAQTAARYMVVDYDQYFALAPGMVLVAAAGHTPGSQMVFVALESGREYLLIGDAAWHMDGVRLVKGKDAPWVSEDRVAVIEQLRWLNALSRTEPRLLIVASHDDEQLRALIGAGALGGRFE
jgi:glyoxylase-like metal-dependent hydrolase (beta-lactamase superfamily II)